jgi:hypothetical protein
MRDISYEIGHEAACVASLDVGRGALRGTFIYS